MPDTTLPHAPAVGSRSQENSSPAGAGPYVERANGFLVVSKSLVRSIAPYVYHLSHDHYHELGDAMDFWNDLERGEFEGSIPVAVLPCRDGVPLGSKPVWPQPSALRESQDRTPGAPACAEVA